MLKKIKIIYPLHINVIKFGETYFSKANTSFSNIPKEINLDEWGIIQTKNIIPMISRKRINITNKHYSYTIKEIKPIKTVYLQSTKKRVGRN